MIEFKQNATNFGRALVTDQNGTRVDDADSVQYTLRHAYGLDIATNRVMVAAPGHTDYNYEVELEAALFALPRGILYEVVVTATKGGRVTPETSPAAVVD